LKVQLDRFNEENYDIIDPDQNHKRDIVKYGPGVVLYFDLQEKLI
jgi:hypothetical protein